MANPAAVARLNGASVPKVTKLFSSLERFFKFGFEGEIGGEVTTKIFKFLMNPTKEKISPSLRGRLLQEGLLTPKGRVSSTTSTIVSSILHVEDGQVIDVQWPLSGVSKPDRTNVKASTRPREWENHRIFMRQLNLELEKNPLSTLEIERLGKVVTTARNLSLNGQGMMKAQRQKILDEGEAARITLATIALKWVLPVASNFANKHKDVGLTYPDYIQAGAIGAIQAATRFDPDKYKNKFVTYAMTRIRGAMWDELREFGALIAMPRSVFWKAKDNVIHAELQTELGREPTPEEIYRKKKEMNSEIYHTLLPLDEPMFMGKGDNDKQTLQDIIPAKGKSPDKLLFEGILGGRLSVDISRLNKQEQTVIRGIFYEDRTLLEIGEILGVSESRTSQIKTAAIKKLGSGGRLLELVEEFQNPTIEVREKVKQLEKNREEIKKAKEAKVEENHSLPLENKSEEVAVLESVPEKELVKFEKVSKDIPVAKVAVKKEKKKNPGNQRVNRLMHQLISEYGAFEGREKIKTLLTLTDNAMQGKQKDIKTLYEISLKGFSEESEEGLTPAELEDRTLAILHLMASFRTTQPTGFKWKLMKWIEKSIDKLSQDISNADIYISRHFQSEDGTGLRNILLEEVFTDAPFIFSDGTPERALLEKLMIEERLLTNLEVSRMVMFELNERNQLIRIPTKIRGRRIERK